MGSIIRLKPELIEKIAAGEVVERPASVVKECIENSIDAKATRIIIELKRGGKEEILVRDNGTGMSREDALLAVERHTTSKIAGLRDLFAIKHLGFRGEALASIAAVSKLTIVTNDNPNSNEATRVMVSNEGKHWETAAAPRGTTVVVRQLFYNTPARRKFLGSDVAELKHVLNIVTRYALAYPNVGFFVKHNGSEILSAPPTPDLKAKVSHIYGKDIAKNMLRVERSGTIKVEGLVGVPGIARKSREYQSFFVNRRYIKSQLLTEALESAYKTLLFLERKPVAVLNLTIDPSKVDVNIHPTKLEIKFDDEDAVFSEVHLAVKEALESNVLIQKQPSKQGVLAKVLSQTKPQSTKPQQLEVSTQAMLVKDEPRLKGIRILGQIAKSYIVAEDTQGLMLVDQHAASERINLERLQNSKMTLGKQTLLQPILVTPPKHQAAIIKHNLEALKELGFDIAEFGQNEFIVREVPVVFKQNVTKELLNELFDEIAQNIKKTPRGLVNEEIVHTMACKAAIKANQELSLKEMEDLLNELLGCKLAYSCAHGRPTIIRFTVKDLERLFKRR
ncbi:DNA mismatch repair endonuclease MutL [Candidatus Woesearchaeota archaeon]|nr:DNA mismatch repair endonuclease MutL [Candidatus Woesearchaeota archaeon]RLE43588.1 MAG: DNA mismatch repair endonuclease MutL [Candidatus Woesearchaeota archaeon]